MTTQVSKGTSLGLEK